MILLLKEIYMVPPMWVQKERKLIISLISLSKAVRSSQPAFATLCLALPHPQRWARSGSGASNAQFLSPSAALAALVLAVDVHVIHQNGYESEDCVGSFPLQLSVYVCVCGGGMFVY